MFTSSDVVAKVREIAAADPEFVYTAPDTEYPEDRSCVYVERQGQQWVGSCLIGRALLALGVATECLQGCIETADKLVRELTEHSSRDDPKWLALVQMWQDEATPWGQAVAIGNSAAAKAFGGAA